MIFLRRDLPRLLVLVGGISFISLVSGCGEEPVKSVRIDSGAIKFYDVKDGDVNLRCAWFDGVGEGSGSIFCYVKRPSSEG